MEKSAAFPEAGVGVVRGPGFPFSEVQGPGPRKEPLGKVDQAMGCSREKQGLKWQPHSWDSLQGLGNGLAQRVFTPPEPKDRQSLQPLGIRGRIVKGSGYPAAQQ